jgi:hypothetical protein
MNTIAAANLRQIKSFGEWRKLFDSTEQVEIKVGLIHALGELSFTLDNYADTYNNFPPVALFLLDVADRYGKRPNYCEGKMADVAFRVLVNRFFKKPKHYSNGVRWNFWKAFVTYEDGQLMEKLFWFFRRREVTGDEEVGFDTRPFENIFSDGKFFPHHEKNTEYQISAIRDFWMEFIDMVYYDEEPQRADHNGGQASLDNLWVKELTSVKMRVRVLDYLVHYGELWDFFRGRIGRPPGYESRGIDFEVMDWIKAYALSQQVPITRTYMMPKNLEQAVLGHSPAAFIVVLHEIGLKEYLKLQPIKPKS